MHNAIPSTRVRGIPVRLPRGRRGRRHRRPGVRRLDVRRRPPQEPDPRHDRHESRGHGPGLPAGRGVALDSGGAGRRRLRASGSPAASASSCWPSLRLGGYLLGWDGGPDQMLFAEKLAREALTHRPSQPDGAEHGGGDAARRPGLDRLGTRSRLGILAAQPMALMTALIALLALIGYAYSALALIGIERVHPDGAEHRDGPGPHERRHPVRAARSRGDGRRQQPRRGRRAGASAAAGGHPHPRGRRLVAVAGPAGTGCWIR